MKKVFSIIAVLIVVILVAFAVFIKVYITPEKVKAFLVPMAEEALNRKVDIGEINISLFKGIEVKNFAIKEIDRKTDFVKCRGFVLKYKLLPLLSRRVVIDELRITSPEIRIVRSSAGKFNFESIGKQEPPEIKEEKEAAEPTGIPVSLLIDKIVVENAGFTLKDYKEELPDIKGSVDIVASIRSAGEDELFSKGSIDLRLDEFVTKKPEKHIKNITAGLKYEVNINLESKGIRINKADIKVQKVAVSIKGDINFDTSPEINLAVSLPKTETADILESVSPFVELKGIALSGYLTADLKLKGIAGKPETLKTDGKITLDKVSVKYNDINALLDGSLKFSRQKAVLDITGAVGKNTVQLKGSITNYFKNQKINLNLYSKRLYLDELMPAGEAKTMPPDRKGGEPALKKGRVKEAEPLDLKLTADGEIRIDSAIYKGIQMDDFYMRYQFKNNKFEIPKMSASIEKGKFNLKCLVDLSKPGYTYNLSSSLDSLHADEIVNSLFPKAKDTVYGVLSSKFKLSGAGTLPENIKKNLIADGDFNVKDGKITKNKIAEKLALFLGIDELKTLNLRQAKGRIKIRNAVARLDSIFSSDDIAMNPSGNIGLDETLDLAFDLKLSPRLTDKVMMKSNIVSYIKDESGWGRIPLKVSGTFSDPSYSVDVEKAGKRIIKKKAKKLIEDIFNRDNIKKPIEDLLKGIFN